MRIAPISIMPTSITQTTTPITFTTATDPHHSHQVEPDRETLPGHKLHVHLRFFGFDLTIPDSSDGDSDRGTRLVDEAGTLVRIVDDPLPDHGRAMDWFGELALAIQLPCIGDVPTPVPILALPPPVTSPPLCDAARHERSGVLLI